MFLEAQVQNITSSPMVMESVKLEPSTIYTVTNLNTIQDKEKRDSTVSGYVTQQPIVLSNKFKTEASRVIIKWEGKSSAF